MSKLREKDLSKSQVSGGHKNTKSHSGKAAKQRVTLLDFGIHPATGIP
jgi:hypothetical protein